ncbi:amidase family protein [Xylona heveae TC161]|uniref:Amidase family protein n=1 Tax=Xylona heveae (strain CBS 132557 / TC161) TaxID=1328760 RepID=A0A165J700_XYLHT|nr:amidase family protein [Xylona heveae TC161]KZF25823.1 amidase family protein [Xylona heveae TC161]
MKTLALSILFSGLGSGIAASAQNDSSLGSAQVLEAPYPYYFPVLQDEHDSNSGLFPMPQCNSFTLAEATIDQLQDAMSSGKLTATQILHCYLQRIYQTDYYVNAIMELNPDMFEIAATLDAERASGKVRGPLHGIPFVVKDNIGTKDKMETTAGSWALLGSVIPRDAHVVAKLREAGALLLGHATLSEWADMRSNYYSEGYSARGGQARSPYNLTVNPGGSSSGSALAVTSNQCMFALGTETDGSVINPAERNSLVGFKPTVGLTSRGGVIPESLHQDSVGTFARTVRDAVYALDAIYGVDPHDNYTFAQQGRTPEGGYVQFLTDKSALKGAVFGLPWKSFWSLAEPEMQESLLELVDLIEGAGATVINGTELPSYEKIVSPDGWDWDFGTTRGYPNESEYTVVKVDFYNNINAYLAELNNTDVRTIEDLVQYNIDNAGSEGGFPYVHPAFSSGQDGFLASLDTNGTMDETYFQALSFCQKATREDGIDAALNHNGTQLAGLLVPVDLGQTYQVAAQAGYPVVTLPAGTHSADGMPFGLGIMQTAWAEATLVRYASAIEDLQFTSNTTHKRSLPNWYEYRTRNIPVVM